ncbi:MAG: hypothetical protein WC967_13485 [Balneolaceae bacterium]
MEPKDIYKFLRETKLLDEYKPPFTYDGEGGILDSNRRIIVRDALMLDSEGQLITITLNNFWQEYGV